MKLRRESKTYQTNGWIVALSVLSQAVPIVAAFVPLPAAIVAGAIALINLGLRELTKEPLAPIRSTNNLPGLLLAALLFVPLAACTSTSGGGAGVVASVTVGPAGAAPAALVRYDGNVLVAWGAQDYVAEMYVQATGLPVLLRAGGAGVAIVRVRKPELVWEGHVGDELPAAAAFLFREAEVEAWGLRFLPAVPTAAPPP